MYVVSISKATNFVNDNVETSGRFWTFFFTLFNLLYNGSCFVALLFILGA